MAWNAPITVYSGSVVTASDFNMYVRDNLLQTGPAIATQDGRILQAIGSHALVEREVLSETIDTAETTASALYTDLATVGPSVTVTTGTRALILMTAEMNNNTAKGGTRASYAVSGSTVSNASDDKALSHTSAVANTQMRFGSAIMETALVAGSNTFTMKYKVGAAHPGTGTFRNRVLVVMAF